MRNRYSPLRWLARSLRFSTQQHSTLLQQMADRIRHSLELNTVLQTTVNEVSDLLEVDSCLFCWYNDRLDTVEVVCEYLRQDSSHSYMGTYTLTEFPEASALLQSRQQVVCVERPHVRAVGNWGGFQTRLEDRANACLLGARASLLLPVEGLNGALGFIACLSHRPRRWSLAEQEFMRAMSQQIEIAVRQAQLYDTTQKLARRERVVNQITTQTRQSFEIETILNGAIAQLLDALQVDRCLVYLIAPWQGMPLADQGYPTSAHRVDPDALFEACRPPFAPSLDCFEANGPITQWVGQYRQMVVIEDIAADPRIGPGSREYQLAHIQSSLVVPVQAGGSLLAILYLNQCSHIRYWTGEDQALAQAVADQLAVSLQQATLYAQLQQQAVASKAHAQQMAEALENLQQMQTQLIQSEKLSSLGQMVAGLAHEINNPISFIYGNIPYVEQYARDLLRLIDAFQQQYPDCPDHLKELLVEVELEFLQQDLPRVLTSMVSGASRIRDIVSTLSSFSQLNHTGSRLLDVHQSLEGTLFVLQNHISPDIQLIREYGELPALACHPRLINQVFMNLLMNAIDALDQPSNRPKIIRITTQQISADSSEQGWVRVAIADTGCGIPQAIQSKIFDPFFTTKPVGKGAGLGLSVCYQTIVHQHHGKLSVFSELDRGSEFIVELPIRRSVRGDRPAAGRSDHGSPAYMPCY